MKKISFGCFLILFQVILSVPLFAGPWEDYQAAISAGNTEKALVYIERAYNNSPEADYLIYNYGFALFGVEQYRKAINILEKLPLDYNSLIVSYYIAEGYNKIGKSSVATELLKKVIKFKDDKQHNKKHLFYLLTKIGHKEINAKLIDSFLKPALFYFDKNPDKDFNWLKFAVSETYISYALNLMAKNDDSSEAVYYLDEAIKLIEGKMGEYQVKFNLPDLNIYKAAAQFWENHHLNKQKAQNHIIQIISVNNLDAEWKDKDGILKQSKSTLDIHAKEILNPILLQLKKIYYYYSQGRLLLDFNYKFIDSKISKIVHTNWSTWAESFDIYTPDFASVFPHPGEFILSKINQFDSLMWIYPSRNVWNGGTGGLEKINLVPYLLDSNVKRGQITLSGDRLDLQLVTLVHEMYHVVQSAFFNEDAPDVVRLNHIYKKSYQKQWPSWYNDEGELFFYKKVFENILLSQGVESLQFRTKKDQTTHHDYNQSIKKLKKYGMPQLALAQKYKEMADEFWAKKDLNQAEIFYLKSFIINKNRKTIGSQLGRIYLEQKKYAQSVEYFEHEISNVNKPELWILTALVWASEKNGDVEKSLKHSIQAYQLHQHSDSLYNIGRFHFSKKRYQKSAIAFEEHLTNFPENSLSPYSLNFLSYIHCYYIVDYQKVIKLVEEHINGINIMEVKSGLAYNLAFAYGESGDKAEALKWLKKAEKWHGKNKKTIQQLIKRYR